MNIPLIINFGISVCAFVVTKNLIPTLSDMFINANLFGHDMCKRTKPKV